MTPACMMPWMAPGEDIDVVVSRVREGAAAIAITRRSDRGGGQSAGVVSSHAMADGLPTGVY